MDLDAAEMEADGNGGEDLGRCLSNFVDGGSTESHRYYLSRRTVLEMLRDRGYAIANSEIELSLEEFRSIHGQAPNIDRLRISASHQSDPRDKILVIFCGMGVVKVNSIRSIATQIMNKDSLSRLILIVQNHITNQAMKAVDLFSFKVEIFQTENECTGSSIKFCHSWITDLVVNVTKHVLKPKHRVLSDDEKQKLLKKHNLEEKQLPRMLQKDAIARYYALEKGLVVEVTYSGEVTGSYVTYRCVW